MNKILIISLLITIVFFFFTSCHKEDTTTPTVESIMGEWNLTSYSAGFLGTSNYNKNDATWTFHKSNNMVDVLINIQLTNNDLMSIRTSQTLTYAVHGSTILIDGVTYDFHVDGQQLILSDNPEADGPSIQFERD